FGNVAIAELFVEKLKKKWIHHTEKNYKLVTEDKDAKRIYQVTFLFKIPEVKVDDYVVFQNDLHRVKQVSAEYISLISMLNHHLITTTDWVDLKAIDPTPYLITKLVVALDSVNESYLLMDLRDYTSEEVNVNRFPNSLNVSNEVNLLVWENQYYLPI
ncbi:MAG: hypothetical protein OEZ01_13820, partial [Candidatus Heimdallarchaeota archaeon]|nr:hypothetical protein [Candidatus Heimdallarchaeota archaeon]